jgi:DNA-binding MarR family transcriptional regulator
MEPVPDIDDLVHQRVRLSILTVLTEAQLADFTTLRDILGLSDGNLSRNLTLLEEHGHVEVEKRFEGRRPRTWVRITPTGAAALDREVAALRDIVRRVERSTAETPHPLGPGIAPSVP